MLGAIFGDIAGSVYEFNPIKTTNFELISKQSTFTDDSILTIAVADWLLSGQLSKELLDQIFRLNINRNIVELFKSIINKLLFFTNYYIL